MFIRIIISIIIVCVRDMHVYDMYLYVCIYIYIHISIYMIYVCILVFLYMHPRGIVDLLIRLHIQHLLYTCICLISIYLSII